MADANRQITMDDMNRLADKLGPAFDSLTDAESEAFAFVLEQAGGTSSEVSGFAQGLSFSPEVLQGLSAGPKLGAEGAAQAKPHTWFAKVCRDSRHDRGACCPRW